GVQTCALPIYERGDRPAVRFGDEHHSFAELDAGASAFAHHLAAAGVGRGDRVAMMLTNRPEFVMALNGISKLGGAAVSISPAWKALEIDHALALTHPAYAIADGDGAALLAERLGGARVADLDDAATLDAILA